MTTRSPSPSFSRYECKYLVDAQLAGAVRGRLLQHMRLDPFSARAEGDRYRISSLYLDGPGLELFRQTEQGIRNRYKLRIRSYTDDRRAPVFLEVKERADQVIRKFRAPVSSADARAFLDVGRVPAAAEGAEHAHRFVLKARRLLAGPALHVRYWREAWQATGGDPVRVTFDTEVEHAAPGASALEPGGLAWRPTRFRQPVILEVKYTEHRPPWLVGLLRDFQLDKRSVAKYAVSVEQSQRSSPQGLSSPSIRAGGPASR